MRPSLHLLVLLCFEQADLIVRQREPLTFPVDFGTQARQQQLAPPGPPVSQDPAPDIRDPKVVQHEQGADSVAANACGGPDMAVRLDVCDGGEDRRGVGCGN